MSERLEEEKKKKFIVLSANIKSHDLHNRIKVAHNIMKKNSILQVFMPIDVINDESLSKGKLIMKTVRKADSSSWLNYQVFLKCIRKCKLQKKCQILFSDTPRD